MGRKRLLEDKRVAFNISVNRKVLEEFKRKVKENNEVSSRIIEKFMIQYLKENNKKSTKDN